MSVSVLITLICLSCLNAACVVVCLRQVSELTSQRNRLRETTHSVELFESQIEELRKRINSMSRKYALEDRRDPETGRSRERDEEEPGDRKAKLRRQYGLVGMSHADIARRASRAGE